MQLPYSNLQLKHQNPGAENALILPVHVICNTSDEEIFSNIRINSRRPGKWVASEEAHNGIAVLCGGGPSLADTLQEVRSWMEQGATIFAMNGVAKYLNDNGILADYQVIIDARQETAQLVGPAYSHLFASQVHPACFEKMPTAKVWHLQVEGIDDVLPDYEDAYCLIGGAASVGNTATCLAYALGYRTLHIYGYDSSHREGKGHAYSQPMNDGDPCASVVFNGKHYIASLTMKLQAEKFQDTARALQSLGCQIHVHGSGLLPDMWNTPPIPEEEKYQRMWEIEQYRHVAPGEQCVDKFLSLADPQAHQLVADLGCGTGRGGQAISKHCRVMLVDFVDNSRDEGIDLPFIKADLSQPIPLRADFGYCTDVMEHIPPEQVDDVLRNVLRVAPFTFFQISLVDDVMGCLIGQKLHLSVHPASWWEKQLNRFGEVVYAEDNGDSAIFYVKEK